MTLTARENTQRILAFDHPERVMRDPPFHWLAYRGANHEGYDGGGHDLPVGSVWVDVWGTQWHRSHEGVMGFPRACALNTPDKLRDYRWPDPDDERICGPIHAGAKAFPGGDVFLAGSHRNTLWEKIYQIVGMENAMEYFFTEPAFMREVLHRIMDFQLALARHYLQAGIEFAMFTDDLGTQQGPLLGPDLVREFFVPEYRRLTSFYKEKGVRIWFHSCGAIEWMIPTFIDLGVDILNPVQATANDRERVRRATQGRLTLHGGVPNDLVLKGPLAAIRAEVQRTLWQLGREGGYFCAPDQHMPFPREHEEAFAQAVNEFGCYPLLADGRRCGTLPGL